ncbi:MAG: Fe-S protein assembly co-chaperone HscB [Thiobacillaceae bacterium]
MLDFNRNHFELFGLRPAFRLSRSEIDRAYRDIQAQIHPDRFVHAGEAEQRLAMQWTTRVNEAYATLREPFERARYLLELNGVQAMDARNTAMPADFLMQQMAWREQLEAAKAEGDLNALRRLEQAVRREAEAHERELAELIDERHDYGLAAESLRKYRFLDKLLADIEATYDEIDG